VEVTNDINAADIIAIYFLNLETVLIIDRRPDDNNGPLIETYPMEEFLLEGAEIEHPLTSEVVHAIERHQQMPGEPEIMESYLRQLADLIAWRVMLIRPTLNAPHNLSLGPHFGPVLVLAHSNLWQELLPSFRSYGDDASARRVQAKMRELFALEIQHPERADSQRRADLAEGLRNPGEFQVYALPQTEGDN
jgi:hypothetical protein